MKTLERFKTRFFGADPESVAAYQSVLPHTIRVVVRKDDGQIIATINKVDKKKLDKSLLITEARDIDSLITNVNDLLYTYVNMPMNIRPYYGNVFHPEGYETLKASKKSEELVLVKA